MSPISFKIADAFVDVEFKTDAAEEKLRRAFAGKRETVNVDADTQRASDRVAAFQKALRGKPAERVKVDADTGAATVKVSQVDRQLKAISDRKVKVDAETAAAERKLTDLKASAEAKIAAINARSIKIDADIAAAEAKLAKLRNERLIGPLTEEQQLKFDADTAAAEARIAQLRVQVQSVRDARIRVDADIASAETKLVTVKAKAEELDRKRAQVQVDADTARAAADLAATQSAVSFLDGQKATVNVDADVAAALAKIAMVSAAIGALGVGAVAGLGAIGAIGAIAAGGIAAVGASAVGVKGAVDALGKSSQSAGGAAGGAASNHLQLAAAMDRVKSAQAALANTRENAAASVRRADQSVEDAERRVISAQEDARLAQEDLTRAREDAAQQAQELAERVSDLALSERDAQLGILEARERLNEVNADGKATDLQRQRAQLQYDEAIERLNDVKDAQTEAAQEKAKADAAGIDGSERVQSALRGVQNANERVTDSQRALATAEQAAADARRQAAYQVAQAQQSVVDAQRAVQQASQQAGAAGGGGIDKIAQAMAGLSPVARDFAIFLRGFIDGPLKDLRQAGQNNLLPGLQQGLEDLVPIMSTELTPAFAEFSRTLGDAFSQAIPALGRFAVPLLRLGTDTLTALSPLGPVFDGFVVKFDQMATRVAANGTLQAGMSGLTVVLGALLDNLPALIETGLRVMGVIGQPLADALNALLPAILALAEALGPLLAAALEALVPPLEAFTKFVTENPELVQGLTTAVLGLIAGFRLFGPISAVIGTLTGQLALVVLGVAALATGVAYAYTHSSTFRAEVGRLWQALRDAGATIRDTVGPAMSSLWQTIQNDLAPSFTRLLEAITPVVTWLVEKLGPAVAGFLTGTVGQAETAVKALSKVLDVFGWIIDKIPGIDGVKESMDNAGTSATDYGADVEEMGRKSDEAKRASDDLAAALDKVSDATLSGRQAERDYYAAVDAATKAVETNGRTLNVHTAAGRANNQALDTLARTTNAHTQALATNGASQKTLDAAMTTTRSSFIKTATQMGLTTKEAKALADKVLKIPKTANTAVGLTGYSATMTNLQSLLTRIGLVNGQRVAIQVSSGAANVREDRVAARAKGGPVERGVPYVVGEDRPELFVPDEPGMIIPDLGLVRRSLAPLTQRPYAGGADPAGGSRTVNVQNLNVHLPDGGSWDMASAADRKRVAESMAREIRDALVTLEGSTR